MPSSTDSRPGPDRRRVLAAGAGWLAGLTAMSACSASPTVGSSGPTAAPSTSPSGSTPPPSSAAGTPRPVASAGPLPTRAEIVQRYAATHPTQWGLAVTGVVNRLDGHGAKPTQTPHPTVALTFDACGAPTPGAAGFGYDRDLIELLRRNRVPATLFLNGRWIAANPGLTDELIHDPLFEIGNHGTRHQPLSVSGRTAYSEQGTSDVGAVYDEVVGNHRRLTELLGHPPGWFRSGTAHYDEVAVRIVGDLGERVAGFAVNGDAGTTFTASQVTTSLATCRDGDIVISHVNRPEHATAEGYAVGLPRLLDRGFRFVTLSERHT